MSSISHDHSSAQSAAIAQDQQRLRSLWWQQAKPHHVVTAMGVLLLVLLWVQLILMLQALGASMDYSQLKGFDGQLSALLTRANPYIWLVVQLIVSLLALALARLWLNERWGSLIRKPLNALNFQNLAPELCADTLAVMAWCWATPRREPLTLGDLRTTLRELQQGRISKLATMHQQQHWIDGPAPH